MRRQNMFNKPLNSIRDLNVVLRKPLRDCNTNVNMPKVKAISTKEEVVVNNSRNNTKSNKYKENKQQTKEHTKSESELQKTLRIQLKDINSDDKEKPHMKKINSLESEENIVNRSQNKRKSRKKVIQLEDKCTNKSKTEPIQYLTVELERNMDSEVSLQDKRSRRRSRTKVTQLADTCISKSKTEPIQCLTVELERNKVPEVPLQDKRVGELNKTSRKDVTECVQSSNNSCEVSKYKQSKISSKELLVNIRKIKEPGKTLVSTTLNSTGESKESETLVQNSNTRQSVPVAKRLRNFPVKNYRESSFADTTLTRSTDETSHRLATKVPIYKQTVVLPTKTNIKDPYELDIVDEQAKQKKRKILDDSAKFNRTMHEVLKKIEKKENKKAKKKPLGYDDKMHNVLSRILKKVHEHKGIPIPLAETVKKNTSVAKHNTTLTSQQTINSETERGNTSISKHNTTLTSQQTINSETERENTYIRRHNTTLTSQQNINIQTSVSDTGSKNTSEVSEAEFRGFGEESGLSKTDEVENGFRGFINCCRAQNLVTHNISSKGTSNDFELSLHSIPSTSNWQHGNDTNPPNATTKINIISNKILNPGMAHVSFDSTINNAHNKTGDRRNLTSLDANPIDNTHNLHREFNDHVPVFSEETVDDMYQSDCEDSYSVDDDDGCFGFREESETTSEKPPRFSNKKKPLPWRVPGIFKRNPYILKIKKNGLPCGQQDMVIDYEFVKRMEALSSNKRPEPPRPKSPVQTTMLDFIESSHEHTEKPFEPSLFDYEEFNVAKPRRVLGLLQENQISTPKKNVITVLASPNLSVISKPQTHLVSTPKKNANPVMTSPNISVIHMPEDQENVNVRPLQKSYKRRLVDDKELENKNDSGESLQNDKEDRSDGALPSVLNDNFEENQDADVHLFEDVDQDKDIDFSIKLSAAKYETKRKKRRIYEGSDDEEKRSKKKKKNMMTKAEKAEFDAWVTSTNARFAEEDKHELTIE